MNHKLSVIIPCFNCALTLEEAVDSVYKQNLTTPFEIVMVDDKSTDQSKDLMRKLSSLYPEIRLFYHDNNKGGGATRNTGIKFSQGDLIFCLDSDNLLFPNTMQRMIDCLEEKRCDGVIIHERRYFKELDVSNYESHFNQILDKEITFENLFDQNPVLMDNFLFRKAAYKKTDGYPEKHGFDTQCFEIRFLAAGNTAYVCPNTVFLHRQSISTKGYFHRVYEKGLFSINFYLIFEEIIYLFSQDTIEDIIMYDIFIKNKLGPNNIKSFITNQYMKYGTKIFRDNFKTYLVQDGAQIIDRQINSHVTPLDTFVRAIFLFRGKKYEESYGLYLKLEKEYPESKIIKYNIARCELGIEETSDDASIETEAIKKSGCELISRKMDLDPGPFKVFVVKIKNFLTKLT